MEEYKFEKKVNLRQLVSELKENGLVHDGVNAFLGSVDNRITYYSKNILLANELQKLQDVFENHIPLPIETSSEKKVRLKTQLDSATTISNLKEIIGELL